MTPAIEIARNGSHAKSAIFGFAKWRSFSRYAGSHVIRKYQKKFAQNWPRQRNHMERGRRMAPTDGTSLLFSRAAAAPRGIQRIHGASQISVPAPSAKKKGRHPKRATSSPPTNVPTAGAALVAES